MQTTNDTLILETLNEEMQEVFAELNRLMEKMQDKDVPDPQTTAELIACFNNIEELQKKINRTIKEIE